MSGHVYLYILSSGYSATVVYLCVTLGVTDSLVLILLGIPLPRSVFHSCIRYSYSYIYTLGIPLTRRSQDSNESQSQVLVQQGV